MVVTPADILASCRAIDERIAIASRALQGAAIEPSFMQAWNQRLVRWAEVRNQCSDWASRWWNYKWGPILDDWRENQTKWDRAIELRIGRPLPAPVPHRQDEELPKLPSGTDLGLAVGVAFLGVLALVAISKR